MIFNIKYIDKRQKNALLFNIKRRITNLFLLLQL